MSERVMTAVMGGYGKPLSSSLFSRSTFESLEEEWDSWLSKYCCNLSSSSRSIFAPKRPSLLSIGVRYELFFFCRAENLSSEAETPRGSLIVLSLVEVKGLVRSQLSVLSAAFIFGFLFFRLFQTIQHWDVDTVSILWIIKIRV